MTLPSVEDRERLLAIARNTHCPSRAIHCPNTMFSRAASSYLHLVSLPTFYFWTPFPSIPALSETRGLEEREPQWFPGNVVQFAKPSLKDRDLWYRTGALRGSMEGRKAWPPCTTGRGRTGEFRPGGPEMLTGRCGLAQAGRQARSGRAKSAWVGGGL